MVNSLYQEFFQGFQSELSCCVEAFPTALTFFINSYDTNNQFIDDNTESSNPNQAFMYRFEVFDGYNSDRLVCGIGASTTRGSAREAFSILQPVTFHRYCPKVVVRYLNQLGAWETFGFDEYEINTRAEQPSSYREYGARIDNTIFRNASPRLKLFRTLANNEQMKSLEYLLLSRRVYAYLDAAKGDGGVLNPVTPIIVRPTTSNLKRFNSKEERQNVELEFEMPNINA